MGAVLPHATEKKRKKRSKKPWYSKTNFMTSLERNNPQKMSNTDCKDTEMLSVVPCAASPEIK